MIKDDFISIPSLSIKAGYATTFFKRYREVQGELIELTRKRNEDTDKNLTKNKKARVFSSQSASKLRNAAFWLFLYTEPHVEVVNGIKMLFSCSFVTLTLPSTQQHTDNEIKKRCLNSFLTKLRTKYELRNYVWKAEKQKNGNLHFHLILDIALHYRTLQDVWNETIEVLNYVSNYRKKQQLKYSDGFYVDYKRYNGKITAVETQRKRFDKGIKERWSNPHTTEIKKVSSSQTLTSYLAKYFSKGTEAGDIELHKKLFVEGHQWGCSANLNKNIVIDAAPFPDALKGCKYKTSDYFTCHFVTPLSFIQTEYSQFVINHIFENCNNERTIKLLTDNELINTNEK